MAIINEYLNTSAAKINIPTPFILKGQAPLDLRQIVQKAEDLVIENFYDGDAPFWYPGMLVSCVENSKAYILKEEVTKDETTGEEIKNYVFVEVGPDFGVQVDGADLKITNTKVNWGLNYNSSNKHIEVVDRNDNDKVMDFIDASDFIKDGMLSSGELVWCTIAADGKHTEVAEGTADAIHCLKLTLHVWQGLVDENNQPIYTEQYVHIPLGELCDPYAGTDGEIVVEEEHGKHAISLADKTVSETTGTALTPAHGGSFNVVTDVTYDTKGRIAGVETTQVTLPIIDNGTQIGTDEYVTVGVKTTAGIVSEVTVNTDALTEKFDDIEDEISENAQVTAAALNDLNTRLNNVDAKERVNVAEDAIAGEKVITKDTVNGVTTLTVHIANKSASFLSATQNGGDYIATAYGVKDYVDNVVCWQEGSF